eukprot:scaffold1448_cov101-Isochrysis_galbana.AAC.1
MRLNADLIARAPAFISALKDREIDLRGNKIALIENLAALQVGATRGAGPPHPATAAACPAASLPAAPNCILRLPHAVTCFCAPLVADLGLHAHARCRINSTLSTCRTMRSGSSSAWRCCRGSRCSCSATTASPGATTPHNRSARAPAQAATAGRATQRSVRAQPRNGCVGTLSTPRARSP